MKPRTVGDRVRADGRWPAERLPRTGLERDRRARRHGRSRRWGSSDGPHGSVALVNAPHGGATGRPTRSPVRRGCAVRSRRRRSTRRWPRRPARCTPDTRSSRRERRVGIEPSTGRSGPTRIRTLPAMAGVVCDALPADKNRQSRGRADLVWGPGRRTTVVEPPRGTRDPRCPGDCPRLHLAPGSRGCRYGPAPSSGGPPAGCTSSASHARNARTPSTSWTR